MKKQNSPKITAVKSHEDVSSLDTTQKEPMDSFYAMGKKEALKSFAEKIKLRISNLLFILTAKLKIDKSDFSKVVEENNKLGKEIEKLLEEELK